MSHDQLGPDGLPKDDVSSYPASAADMQRYVDDSAALSRFQAPVLIHAGNPHEYLYVACFDGTGNDKNKDPQHETNVGKIADQIFERFGAGQRHVAQGYVAGPGTEDSWLIRTFDGASGYTYDARLERMYELFINQARSWKEADPQAQIRIAETGFSRGAEQAAGFARLIEERGIQDPTGAIYTKNSHNEIIGVQYTRPPLVPPHDVAQAVALFDPVGTGDPVKHEDRRLPPSVISGIQLISTEERRWLFKSDHIIDPGLSSDGRFLGMYVPGAHSDVGGGYIHNGLSTHSGNLVTDYLNSLSDTPFLGKSATYDNPDMDVVHRSERGSLLYWLTPKVDRLKPEGYHSLEAAEDQNRHGSVKGDPYNAEPINATLSAQFDRHGVAIGALPLADNRAATQHTPQSQLDAWIDQLHQGTLTGNDQTIDQTARDYLQSSQGQAWQMQVQDQSQAMQTQAQEQALQQQRMQRAQGFSL